MNISSFKKVGICVVTVTLMIATCIWKTAWFSGCCSEATIQRPRQRHDRPWPADGVASIGSNEQELVESTTNESLVPTKLRCSWMDFQQERRLILDRACNQNPSLKLNLTQIVHENKQALSSYIVDDRFRLIFGFLLKVGSTNWKKAFFVLKGDYKQVEDVPDKRSYGPGLKDLNSYTPEEIEYRLKNYTKFIFVRDPYARVLSAYRNKFYAQNKLFHKLYGRSIIARFRPDATDAEKKSGASVTFQEFVRAITSNEKRFEEPHWALFHRMVLPCTIKLDFIGKLETGAKDAVNIMKCTKIDHLIHFKVKDGDSSHQADVFQKFYSQLSADDLKALQAKYKLDFELFGYDLEP